MKILSSRRFALWWQLAMDWFQRQFAAIAASIDFTPVEEKLDEVKSDVADVKTAVDSTKQEIRNVAGPCIIPDLELPCLPFEKHDGFSGLYDDGDFYFGDFAPQAGSIDSQLFVGAIIKVTGENSTEDEFAGFPVDSRMSVAHTVSEEEAGYEQGLYGTLIEGEPVYGVTSEITWQKDHYYRVTGFHDIYDMTNNEVVEGYVITYEEVDPATITDMGKKIVEKLDELDVHDENAKHLAQFFGVTLLEGYEFMQDTEVTDELEDIMRIIDPDLTAEQAAAITAQTLNPSER
jgi:hypothetical protein